MRRPADITLDAVSRHYATHAGPVRALDGLTLQVAGGTSVAVTGPSGCGKSTLLGLLGGLEAPTAGRVEVGGFELSTLPEERRVAVRRQHLGFVFQSDNLLPFLTARENVAQQLALASMRENGQRKGGDGDGGDDDGGDGDRCAQLLGDLGLEASADKLPDQLSGGQRQRVAVARALVHRPALLLADEPTGSVDAANAETIVDLLLRAQRQTGATLVVVTHDTAVARRLDRVVELRDGRQVGGLRGPEA